MSKEFIVTFPIYGSGVDRIQLTDDELKKFETLPTELEKKMFLMEKVYAPVVCHHCNDSIEDVEINEDNYNHISYYEENED